MPALSVQRLLVKAGDKVQTAWGEMLSFAEDSTLIFGKGIKTTVLPGGGVFVQSSVEPRPWLYPWKMSLPDSDDNVQLRDGTVNGALPWVDEEHKMGDNNEDGVRGAVAIKPKESGVSWIAVGVNVLGGEGVLAEINLTGDGEATWEQLRLKEIEELPGGFGSGGVQADDEGWAWYPLVKLFWDGKLLSKFRQVVHHNLSHQVVLGGATGADERHFFWSV